MVEGRRVALGNASFLPRARHRHAGAGRARPSGCARDGATAIFLAVDGKLAGVIAIADPVKRTTPEALEALARKACASSC